MLSFHPLNSYGYIKDNNVLGVILLATNALRPLKFNEVEAIKLFGKFKGTALCKEMNGIFQSKVVTNDTDLYIDMLAVKKSAENHGIGSKLLEFAFSLKGYKTYYLEVLSKNKNAKGLYEKVGFIDVKKNYFSPIRLLGYGYPIKIKKIKCSLLVYWVKLQGMVLTIPFSVATNTSNGSSFYRQLHANWKLILSLRATSRHSPKLPLIIPS